MIARYREGLAKILGEDWLERLARDRALTERKLVGVRRNRTRIHGATSRQLGIAILRGEYLPGDCLPTEAESSAHLTVSRSAYREALKNLASKGMVVSKPKFGTRVTERSRWVLLDPEVLEWMEEAEPSEEFVLGLFELRLIIEPAAATLAAERRSDSHIRRMEKALHIMAKDTLLTESGREADLEFHTCLLEACRNEMLFALAASVNAAISWSTEYKRKSNQVFRDPMPDHYAVLDAVRRQDQRGAAWCMESLIRSALKDTQDSLRRLG